MQVIDSTTSHGRKVDSFAFDNQDVNPVDMRIQPGDSFITSCYYDSSLAGAGANVSFGYGSNDEMCIDFLYVPSPLPSPTSGHVAVTWVNARFGSFGAPDLTLTRGHHQRRYYYPAASSILTRYCGHDSIGIVCGGIEQDVHSVADSELTAFREWPRACGGEEVVDAAGSPPPSSSDAASWRLVSAAHSLALTGGLLVLRWLVA